MMKYQIEEKQKQTRQIKLYSYLLRSLVRVVIAVAIVRIRDHIAIAIRSILAVRIVVNRFEALVASALFRLLFLLFLSFFLQSLDGWIGIVVRVCCRSRICVI
jgi:hypothetical protein